MKIEENFWVLPCLEDPFRYVVYRNPNKEIMVEIREGVITATAEALTIEEQLYFKRKILTNQPIRS